MNNSNSLSNIEKEKFLEILKALFHDNQSTAFQEPVDYIELNLPEYPEIIKNPMDLGTIKEKLENDEYSDINQIVNDFDLIWENCFTFNKVGSDIYKSAQYCKKLFKKQMEKQFKNYIISSGKKEKNDYKNNNNNNEGNLTMTEKMNLTDKIRILSNEGLTQVVKLIMKECPNGIEDIDSEKLQIKIDLIDHRTYDLLLETIDNCLKNDDKEKK